MTFLDTEMKKLDRSIQINTRNTRSLIRTPQVCLKHLTPEEPFTVKEYKHIHKHTQVVNIILTLEKKPLVNCSFTY